MDEKKLIKKLLSRDYRKRLTKFVARKVRELEDVEEIVQDTLMSGLDSLPMFKGNSDLFTWLCSIARHETADFYRRQKIKRIVFSRLPFLEKLVSEALGPELAYQELETKRRIVNVWKKLSEGYAEILRLKYIDGLSMKVIAKKLGLTVKAVESKLFRARMAFQKEYEKSYQLPVTNCEFFEEDREDWGSFGG
jgi:RNA polymerase sigma-70 factor (ECF subfamily)